MSEHPVLKASWGVDVHVGGGFSQSNAVERSQNWLIRENLPGNLVMGGENEGFLEMFLSTNPMRRKVKYVISNNADI